jgi:hypothetical protein
LADIGVFVVKKILQPAFLWAKFGMRGQHFGDRSSKRRWRGGQCFTRSV